MEIQDEFSGLENYTGVPKQIQRHPDKLLAKAKTHAVVLVDVQAQRYKVVSGGKQKTGGNTYTVNVFKDGGASCDCDWARKRQDALVENKGATACSHTIAVFMFIAEGQGRKVSGHASEEQAHRQHRPIVDAKDGLMLTTRKAVRRFVQSNFLALFGYPGREE